MRSCCSASTWPRRWRHRSSTSFLGLRRYLRQRRLEMPAAMAGVWLTTGAVLIVALLFVTCALAAAECGVRHPRLPIMADSEEHDTSKLAVGKEGVEDKTPNGPWPRSCPEDQKPDDDGHDAKDPAATTRTSSRATIHPAARPPRSKRPAKRSRVTENRAKRTPERVNPASRIQANPIRARQRVQNLSRAVQSPATQSQAIRKRTIKNPAIRRPAI